MSDKPKRKYVVQPRAELPKKPPRIYAQAWEQLISEGETDKQYAMFKTYLDAGKERSLAKVAEKHFPPKPDNPRKNMVVGCVGEASTRFRWRERVWAWDGELDRLRREKQIKSVLSMHERHANTAMALQEKALRRLAKMNVDELGPNEVLRFIIEAAKLESTARGVNEVLKVEHSVAVDPAEQSLAKEESKDQMDAIMAIFVENGILPPEYADAIDVESRALPSPDIEVEFEEYTEEDAS